MYNRASVVRFSNGVFEIRLHMQGVASDVQLVPHENYVLVTGRVSPRAHIDANGTTSKVLWADYPCGYFGRDVQLKIGPNTTVSFDDSYFPFQSLSNCSY